MKKVILGLCTLTSLICQAEPQMIRGKVAVAQLRQSELQVTEGKLTKGEQSNGLACSLISGMDKKGGYVISIFNHKNREFGRVRLNPKQPVSFERIQQVDATEEVYTMGIRRLMLSMNGESNTRYIQIIQNGMLADCIY